MTAASIQTVVRRGAAQELPIAVVVVKADGTEAASGSDATAANQTTQITAMGSLTETAPASDTASSGLNGRLQRIAQRLTSLIALIPASLGIKTSAASLSVAPSSDGIFQTIGTVVEGGALPNLLVIGGYDGAGARRIFAGVTAFADATSNTSSGHIASKSFGFVKNGSTWDCDTKANATSRIVSSAASTNATLAKSSAGNVFNILGRNTSASVLYLKLYNKASAPTVGTDTPVMTIPLPATSAFPTIEWLKGYYFSTGIAYAITTGSPDADTGAVSAGDVIGLNLTYS